jgi:Ca-activated chloride channel family protein
VVTDGTPTHRILQPVEPPAGWDMLADVGFAHAATNPMMTFAGAMTPARAGRAARGSGRMGMTMRRRLPPAERAPSTAQRLPEEVRSTLEQELRLMRERAGETDVRRAAWLADLGARLSELVARLLAAGLHTPEVHGLHLLAEELSFRGGATRLPDAQLDQLWHRCETLLASLAGPPAAGGTPTRGAFWKARSPGEPPDPAR